MCVFVHRDLTWWFEMPPFRRLCLLSRWERSGVAVGGHPRVRHHQAEDQRVVSPPASLRDSRQKIWTGAGGGADVGARTHLQRWLDSCTRMRKALRSGDVNVDGAKKSAFTVNVVEHCAFLWSEVLQCSPSACWREPLQSFPSTAIRLFNLESVVLKVKRPFVRELVFIKDCQSSRLNNLPRTSENWKPFKPNGTKRTTFSDLSFVCS